MCEHLKEVNNPHHYFYEKGAIDNHGWLICDICGEFEDLGILPIPKGCPYGTFSVGVVKY